MARPQDFRGKPVVVRGDVWHHKKIVIRGLPVIQGELQTDNGFCCFYWTRVPKDDFNEGIDYEIHGLFMKTVTFTDESGREVPAALVIASHPTSPPQGKSSGNDATGTLELMIQILVVLVILYFVMVFFRRRSVNRAADAMRRARERVERIKADARAEEEEEEASRNQGEPKAP